MKMKSLVLLTAVLFMGCNQKGGVESAPTGPAGGIQWVNSLSDGLRASAESSKPVMVDFYAEWCGWCKKLDKETYSDKKIVALSEKFINVKVDTDKNPQDARKYGVNGLPTIVFLDKDGNVIQTVVGYREAGDFEGVMSEVLKK